MSDTPEASSADRRGGRVHLGDHAARRAGILAAARAEFLANGYAATTMSAVAARAGGSKTTLWNHFPSKCALFAAVVEEAVDDLDVEGGASAAHASGLEVQLRQAAWALTAPVRAPETLTLQRIVLAEAGRFPELGALYLERNQRRLEAGLAGWLATAMTKGLIRAGNPVIAARQFTALCHAGEQTDVLWGAVGEPDAARMAADIEVAIDCWMRGWTQPQPARTDARDDSS